MRIEPSPNPSPIPTGTSAAEIAPSHDANIVRVHYHRFDDSYDDITLWTWDAAHNTTPAQNELTPKGRDEFGVYFEFDKRLYGVNGSGTIGLLPRFGRDWGRKDGPDRYWVPEHGERVWIMGSKPTIYTTPPDISPRVVSAYADAPDRFTIVLNRLVNASDVAPHAVTVSNLTHPVPVAHTTLVAPRPDGRSFQVQVDLAAPVDVVKRPYRVAVRGFNQGADVVPRRLLDNKELFYDGTTPLGALYSPGQTTFRVFAPTASEAHVVLYDEATGKAGRRSLPMNPGQKGVWELTVAEPLLGHFYTYTFTGPDLDSSKEVVDPYATNTVASTTRARISDLAANNPPGWERLKRGPRVASPVDIIVYEMHVRDFTISPNSGVKNHGLYLGWSENGTRLMGDSAIKTGLDHLSELGITHVQILPVHDFSNDEAGRSYNWGYITSAFFSPEGMYASDATTDARIRELKALIAALHSRGIGVILDVVYNHTSEGAPFNSVVPGYYYRQLADGTFSNGSGCGNEFRTESPMGSRLVIDSLKYWVEEFGVDGFRFDLMALMDRATMKQAETELRKIRPDIILYGEPWMAAGSPVPEPTDKHGIRGTGIGAFNDDFRNTLKGSPDGDGQGWIQNGGSSDGVKQGIEGMRNQWPESPAQTINYMTCHDNLVLYDKLKRSMPNADEATILATMKVGYLSLFTAQGVPFMHGGEEFARSKGGNHNSYDAPDSVNQVDWSLKRKNFGLFTYVRDLIAIRKAHPIFRLRTYEEIGKRVQLVDSGTSSVVTFTLDGRGLPGENWRRACVVVNASDHPANHLQLPPGSWQLAFDQNGAIPAPRAYGENATLPAKSGVILFER